jgi:hypothetical protein
MARRAERNLAGQRLIQHDAERIEVRLAADGVPERLLGGDVVGRAEHAPADRQAGLVAAAGDPEVGDLGSRLGVEQDVLRLDVAVDDPVRVGGVQRARDLDRERHGLGDRQPPDPADALLQRLALDVLEHDERHAVVLARVQHGDDVGVLELRHRARLAAEALDVLDLSADRSGQHLDRHTPLEHGVEGQPDPRRRARADLALEPVAPANDGLRRGAHRRVLCAPRPTDRQAARGQASKRLPGRCRLAAPRAALQAAKRPPKERSPAPAASPFPKRR